MSVQRSFAAIVVGACALACGAYLLIHDAITTKLVGSQPLSAANECSDPASQTSVGSNPNTVQFVSCGGFLN